MQPNMKRTVPIPANSYYLINVFVRVYEHWAASKSSAHTESDGILISAFTCKHTHACTHASVYLFKKTIPAKLIWSLTAWKLTEHMFLPCLFPVRIIEQIRAWCQFFFCFFPIPTHAAIAFAHFACTHRVSSLPLHHRHHRHSYIRFLFAVSTLIEYLIGFYVRTNEFVCQKKKKNGVRSSYECSRTGAAHTQHTHQQWEGARRDSPKNGC